MRWGTVLFSVMLAMAGCAGSDSGKKGEDGAVDGPSSVVGTEDPDKGKIIGSILTDEDVPIGGATVHLLGTTGAQLQATSDASGAFTFQGLESGNYLLQVLMLGFQDFQLPNVVIGPGEVKELPPIRLLELPSSTPWQETRETNGIVTAWGIKAPVFGQLNYPITCGASCNKNYDDWFLHDLPSAMNNIVAELQWQETQVLGGNLRLIVSIVRQSDDAAKTFMSFEGPNPINIVVTKEQINAVLLQGDDECKLDMKPQDEAVVGEENAYCHLELFVYAGVGNTNLDVDVAFALQQTFKAAITTFYRVDAAPGWSFYGA